MGINLYNVTVNVVMVVYVFQIHLMENFVNVLMDILEHIVKYHFVSDMKYIDKWFEKKNTFF